MKIKQEKNIEHSSKIYTAKPILYAHINKNK